MALPRFSFGCEARVGKDTACDHLVKIFGECQRLSFASALYDVLHYAQNVCNFPEEKDRTFLQWVGTEWARAKNPDVWVNIIRRKIESLPKHIPIVVSDVRFPNEIKMLKELGFTTVRITRDAAKRGETPKHVSEIGLLDYEWDIVIENNGSLEELYQKLDSLV